MKKVTGLGGIFFKSSDPKGVKDWYAKNLGMKDDGYGATFEWRNVDNDGKGMTIWSPFSADTKYFEPSKKDFIINYRVEDIKSLVEQLRKDGVTIIDEIQDSEYGKFVHILDPEGNNIELWEPPNE